MLLKRLKLILLSWAIYGGSIAIYTVIPFYQTFLQSEHYHFLIQKMMLCLLCVYSIFVLLFKKNTYILEEERVYKMYTGLYKIFVLLRSNLHSKVPFSKEEKTSLLLFLVKFYFTPIMSIFALNGFFDTIYYGQSFLNDFSRETIFQFSPHLIFSVLLFIDVSYFLLGYIFESASFNNVVISVEKTILGWVVCIVCYPPFSDITNSLFGSLPNEFFDFGNDYINSICGGVILILTGIYVWATISLGSKASNLTNRGIVSHGAYQFVRHPAYASKNLVWWILGLPLMFSPQLTYLFSQITFFDFLVMYIPDMFIILFGLTAWSFIYYLRAVTEERHLRADPSYCIYMEKVPYRFIPKLW